MMKKVYIHVYGDEMPPKFGGVFTTREAAEAALRFGDEHGEIVEQEVDPRLPEGPAGQCLFFVGYAMRNPEFIGYRIPAFEPYGLVNTVTVDASGDLCVHLWAQDRIDSFRKAYAHFERYLEARKDTARLAQMSAALVEAHDYLARS